MQSAIGRDLICWRDEQTGVGVLRGALLGKHTERKKLALLQTLSIALTSSATSSFSTNKSLHSRTPAIISSHSPPPICNAKGLEHNLQQLPQDHTLHSDQHLPALLPSGGHADRLCPQDLPLRGSRSRISLWEQAFGGQQLPSLLLHRVAAG